MTPQDALVEILGRVGASQTAAAKVNDEELKQWPSVAVKAMKSQKLIVKTRQATSAICPGCEYNCVMPVHTLPVTTGAPLSFIVCDKRDDINRVPVPIERLTQWKCGADGVCRFIAVSLELRSSRKQTAGSDLLEIGIVFGDKRSQMLCLQSNGVLTLVAGNNTMPLAEVIDYHDGKYSIDRAMIRQLVDTATTADDRYTPSNARREARKLETKAMHECWRKEYRRLKKKHENMSDAWISQKIAKMDIAHGRDAETIRKKMKR